jgi:hypothetical protein
MKNRYFFDSSYNEKELLSIENKDEEDEEWNFNDCESLLEAQIDKFFLLMNEFITDNIQKLDKTKCIIPEKTIYYSGSIQFIESWKSIKIEKIV